jgi:hypothetical protein
MRTIGPSVVSVTDAFPSSLGLSNEHVKNPAP